MSGFLGGLGFEGPILARDLRPCVLAYSRLRACKHSRHQACKAGNPFFRGVKSDRGFSVLQRVQVFILEALGQEAVVGYCGNQ